MSAVNDLDRKRLENALASTQVRQGIPFSKQIADAVIAHGWGPVTAEAMQAHDHEVWEAGNVAGWDDGQTSMTGSPNTPKENPYHD